MQYVDKISDVLVVAQRRVPTIPAAQETEDVAKVQLLDPVTDVLVMLQRHVPVPRTTEEIVEIIPSMQQERTQERIVEANDVHVSRVEVVKHIPQEQAQNSQRSKSLTYRFHV